MTAAKPCLPDALIYAARGWPVLPLWWPVARGGCACGRPGCGKSIGKHPIYDAVKNGVNGATTDAACITLWWGRWPQANVGIRTGRESGLAVLDVDPRNGGDDSLAELEERIGPMPETPVSITGSLGSHYLFAYPSNGCDVPCARNLGGLAGLDWKADGGYIVAPPSLHASGRRYTWNVMLHPADVPIAPCPGALLTLADEMRETVRAAYTPQGTAALPPHAERLISREGSRLRARYERHTYGLRDTSPSGVDASLASLAALAGLAGPEVEAVLRTSRERAGLPPKGTSYYRSTVGLALAAVQERHESARRLGLAIVEDLRHA